MSQQVIGMAYRRRGDSKAAASPKVLAQHEQTTHEGCDPELPASLEGSSTKGNVYAYGTLGRSSENLVTF